MKSNLAIKIQVNLPRLLENLGHAFSKPLTVISELLQNARRAGASKVSVNYDDETKTLVVADDGCGITDFQNLLTVAESGWDQEVKDNECPYGMGFLASLYACEHIEAASVCGTVSFTTKQALQFGEIPVASGDPIKGGTLIALRGFKADISVEVMKKIVIGFPLPVSYNGEELPRPYALANLPAVETALGHISIRGIHRGEPGCIGDKTDGYLLGFKVFSSSSSYYSGDVPNIVHLAPRSFQARMPDRDSLVDPDKARKKIEAEINRLWQQHLEQKARELPAEQFLATYETATLTFHKELLNSIPMLPASLTSRIDDVPEQGYHWSENGARRVSGVTREQVESGEVVLCDDIGGIYEESSIVPAMFAYLGNFTMVEAQGLDENHWAKPFIRSLEEEEFEVSISGKTAAGNYSGWWTGGDVVVGESYTIKVVPESMTSKHGPRSVTCTEHPIFCCLDERDTFIFPGETCNGDVVRQASAYEEDESFKEEDRDHDSAELTRVVRQLRGASADQILKSLLSDIYFSKYDILKGKAFAVWFSSTGELHVEEAIDAEHD